MLTVLGYVRTWLYIKCINLLGKLDNYAFLSCMHNIEYLYVATLIKKDAKFLATVLYKLVCVHVHSLAIHACVEE